MPKKSTASKLDKLAAQEPASTAAVVNPNRQAEIVAIADKMGLTTEHLIKTIIDGTLAMKVTYDKLGNVIGEEHDTAARLKAAGIGLELRGDTNSKINIGTQNNVVAVVDNLNVIAKTRLSEWKRTNVKDI